MGWWEDITGQTQAQAAAQGQAAATQAAGQANKIATGQATAAKAAGAGYDAGLQGSLGANAGDYASRANASAQAQATQQARAASTQAAQQAAKAAKSGGMNAGEAALIGGQQVGNVYQNQLAAGMQQGTQLYGQGTQMIGAAGAEQANRQQQAAGTILAGGQLQTGQAAQQAAQGQAANQQFWGTVAGLGGALLSDERLKEKIRAAIGISRQLPPAKSFDYKAEAGGEKGQIGVMAQDLEGGPLAEAVIETPEGVKGIDPAKASGGLLAVASDLADRVAKLEALLGREGK